MYDKTYVYAHYSPDGRMIYCGIGTQGRAWEQTKRDGYHRNIISSYEHDYVELLATGLSREEALLLERKTIREYDCVCNIQERIK